MLDGILIGTSYLVSPSTGFSITLAILLHEIPQEIGDFGVLVHAGLRPAQALLLNFLTALLAVIGALIGLSVGHLVHALPVYMLPLRGRRVHLHRRLRPHARTAQGKRPPAKSLAQLGAIGLGIACMLLVRLLE